eukprot:10026_1
MAQKGHGGKGSGQRGGNKGDHGGGQIVRFSSGKHKFEVITNKGTALQYRDNKIAFNGVLMTDQIFTNVTRGDVANPRDLSEVFGTEDLMKCCERIVKEGELQYTAQERKEFVEEKTREIVYYINKNYVDPKTKLPHPSDRISTCMKDCHIRVDPKGDTRRQAEAAVAKMRGKIMFAKAVAIRAQVTIKHAQVGQCNNIIHKLANVLHEEWSATGCIFTVEMSNADLNLLKNALMKPTNGDYEMQFLDENEAISSQNDEEKDKDKKKKKKKDQQ